MSLSLDMMKSIATDVAYRQLRPVAQVATICSHRSIRNECTACTVVREAGPKLSGSQ